VVLHLTKGMCTKCLANSSYVVLPFRDSFFYPERIEAVILVSADHLQLDSRDPPLSGRRVRSMASLYFQEKQILVAETLIAVSQVVPVCLAPKAAAALLHKNIQRENNEF
jgi:hypothetical protein